MKAHSDKALVDRPWLDPDAEPFIHIEGVTKKFGDFVAVDNVNLSVYKGELFALLGGSGCGKSTLLRMLAGFETPTAGRILIDGVDTAGVAPYDRPVNMMFQSYALFPHMTVEKNVAYGLKRDGLPAKEIRDKVADMLGLVQLTQFAKRKPHQLSGGQRQRVALARALIKQPKVLLLDEPLGALDKKLREQTQFELMNIQEQVGITFVVVTHDQEEAMTLSSRIAVMNQGEIIQVGEPTEIYEYPQTKFTANFIGDINMFEGRVTESGQRLTVDCDGIDTPLVVDQKDTVDVGADVAVAVRPEKIHVSKAPPNGDEENVIKGTVHDLGYLGSISIYRIELASGKMVHVTLQNQRRRAHLEVEWDDEVFLSWEATDSVALTE